MPTVCRHHESLLSKLQKVPSIFFLLTLHTSVAGPWRRGSKFRRDVDGMRLDGLGPMVCAEYDLGSDPVAPWRARHSFAMHCTGKWDFGLWTTGFGPPWTLDVRILSAMDFGLHSFDPLAMDFGLWLLKLSVELGGSPGGTCHINTFIAVFI